MKEEHLSVQIEGVVCEYPFTPAGVSRSTAWSFKGSAAMRDVHLETSMKSQSQRMKSLLSCAGDAGLPPHSLTPFPGNDVLLLLFFFKSNTI